VGDTIIVDNGSEPGRVPLPFHPLIQGEDKDESSPPLSSLVSEIQGLFKGLRIDRSSDTRTPENRQNASKKRDTSGA
jgi:hypothetical protein